MPIRRSLKIAWGIALTFACALMFLEPDAMHVAQALLTLVILSALCVLILHCWRTGAYPLAIAMTICGLGVLAGVLMLLVISFTA
ncbi:hypothetical protein DEDE109153_08880 [Deinococcus deserti]|uniref:Uncharacterized protein n=1 Tax=Deinococcus deserti (strain DSM 17065 / CIP 109153 / LMG 22923 / VCD115) TaxID=546414 RepID=C1D419_DEIDV|nr:hypothetical protein [Deinococcus deserti]ACO48248.1 Hypothetical protein; putative membrane protein [Deinococcus deserti VCD115]